MILERYIHREILSKLAWLLGLLLLILTSNRFVDYLAAAAAGSIPSDLILAMLVMKMNAMLPQLMPAALLLSVILAMSRLIHDRELTVISSAGINERFTILSILKFSLLFSFIVFFFSFYLAPWAEGQVIELKTRAEVESDIVGITAGQFKELNKGDKVVYVQKLSNKKDLMTDVFLQIRLNKNLGVLNSKSAQYIIKEETGSRYVIFENGRRYVGQPGMQDYEITRYSKYGVLLEQGDTAYINRQLESIPTSELWGSSLSIHQAEIQWRLSFVIASLMLPMFAFALSRFSISESRYASIFVAVLIYLIYGNLLGLSKNLLKRDDLPVYIGLWWVHILLFLLVLTMLNWTLIRHVSLSVFRRRNPVILK